jgi:uncharacterized protein (TIGR00661 family)
MNGKKRILVAPLDWGLGHAARCVPLINELLHCGAEVVIGADSRPADLLRQEFPDVKHIRFPGYAVQYDNEGRLIQTIIRQLPKMMSGFWKEHRYLEQIVEMHGIDAVIADSRFGAYSAKVYSIFLIHQLHILLPPPLRWVEKILRYVNRNRCSKFDEIWIPDLEGSENLGGLLSHPPRLPSSTFYIGPMTRLKKIEATKSVDILVILSGPEPQRTVLEELLLKQLTSTSYITVIVRGKPEHNTTVKVSPTITMINSLDSDELSQLIASSHLVVSRPGYSTIMDLSYLGAKAIFIPTPQQTEQEYLAEKLMKKRIAYFEPQSEFNLERAIQQSSTYVGFSQSQYDKTILRQHIERLLNILERKR